MTKMSVKINNACHVTYQNLMAETLPVVLQAYCGSRQGTEHRTAESGNLAVSFYYQYTRGAFSFGMLFLSGARYM